MHAVSNYLLIGLKAKNSLNVYLEFAIYFCLSNKVCVPNPGRTQSSIRCTNFKLQISDLRPQRFVFLSEAWFVNSSMQIEQQLLRHTRQDMNDEGMCAKN